MPIRTLATVLLTTIAFAGAATLQVRPGDTLSGLASRSGTTSQALLQLNPGLNPRLLQVGTVLQVPGPSAASGSVVVKRGDTLSGLSRQYKIGMSALLAANPRVDPRRALQVGQKLTLPPAPVLIRRSASPAPRIQATGIRVTAVMPVQGRLTTPYRTGHEGLDLAAPTGTLIRAARAGVVTESRFDGRTGWGAQDPLQSQQRQSGPLGRAGADGGRDCPRGKYRQQYRPACGLPDHPKWSTGQSCSLVLKNSV